MHCRAARTARPPTRSDLPPVDVRTINPEAPLEGLHDHWQEQPAPRLKWWWWLIVVALCALACWLVARGVDRASAHMHDRPDLDSWFSDLKSKGGGLCCSFVDGTSLADVDWRTTKLDECRKDSLGAGGGEAKGTQYCVKLEDEWWLVPDDRIVNDPNRYGPAIVWRVPYHDTDGKLSSLMIRCFMPGAGA